MTTHDAAFRDLFDAANKVLEAAYVDEKAARQAIDALDRLQFNIARRISDLSTDVTKSISDSAAQTAEKAADLLTQKFTAANVCADEAAERYKSAADRLGWKLFGFALLLQLAILASSWLIMQRAMPSGAEIEERRALVDQLSQQASSRRSEIADLDRQLTSQKRKLAELDRRGSRAEWSTCQDEAQVQHLCFRTDERLFQGQDGERTYRVPWGY